MFSNAKSLRKNTDVDRIIIILGTAQRGGRDELQKKKNAVLQKGNAHESLLPTSFSLWFIIFHYTPYVYLIKNNGKPWVDSFSAVWAARKPSKGAFFAELHPLRLGCVAAAEKHAKLRKTAAAQISGANMHTPWLPLRPPPLVGWAGTCPAPCGLGRRANSPHAALRRCLLLLLDESYNCAKSQPRSCWYSWERIELSFTLFFLTEKSHFCLDKKRSNKGL